MQAPAPTPVPAWTYQAPRSPASDPDQRYYRTASVFLATVFPKQKAPAPALVVYRNPERASDTLELEVCTGCGQSRVVLGPVAALALRDALNDAIEDIVQAQLDAAEQGREDVSRAEVTA